MSMSERGMPKRFLPGNATKFLHRRSMELLGLCLLTLAFSFLLINLTYNSADPSFNTSGSSETKNLLGSVGAAIADISLQGLGLANIAIIIVLGAWGIQLVSQRVIGRVMQRIFCLFIAIAMIATSFAALPTPDIWPLNTGLGGVTGWILFQQLVRVEEALNFSASFLVSMELQPACNAVRKSSIKALANFLPTDLDGNYIVVLSVTFILSISFYNSGDLPYRC